MAHLGRLRSGDRQRALLVAAYVPATVTRYNDAVRQFLTWLRRTGVDFNDASITYDDLDLLLTDWLHQAKTSGSGRTIGQHALSGLLRLLPHARGRLPDAHTALLGWGRLAQPRSHPPLTYNLACLLAVQMARHGADWLRDAVGVLLAFDCLLRVGELAGIRREHVADGCDGRLGTARPGASHGAPGVAPAADTLLVALPRTKTGRNQSVYVGSPAVKCLLRQLVLCTAPGALLFPSSAARFRRRLQTACSELRLPTAYVPHSLRHGGATHLYLRRVAMADIMARGRWRSLDSAQRYIQSGRAALLAVDVPAAVGSAAAVVADNLLPALSLVVRLSTRQPTSQRQ